MRRYIKLSSVALLLVAAVLPKAAAEAATDEWMPVPGGTARLLRVAGIRVPVEPERALLVLVRAVHGSAGRAEAGRIPALAAYLAAVSQLKASLALTDAGARRAAVIEACGLAGTDVPGRSNGPATGARQLLVEAGFPVDDWAALLSKGGTVSASIEDDLVPALLPLELWQAAVLGKPVASGALAAEIVGDRRAALLYYGLHSLDDATLEALAGSPGLVADIHRELAAPFAAFAESISISGGRAVVPGGEEAAPIWEALAGAETSRPDRFIPSLLARDGGRLAWMFDTVAHADRARQAFALRLAASDPRQRIEHGRRLYSTFTSFQRRTWTIDESPFARAPADPSFALPLVAATADGRMVPPASRRFWQAAFGESRGGRSEDDEVEAAWLVERLASGSAAARRARLNAVLFAQRAVSAGAHEISTTGAGAGALAGCVAAFPAYQMLLLSLERIGLTDPADCLRAVRAADLLVDAGDPSGTSFRTAMFQGALTLTIRLATIGTLEAADAGRVARDLFGLPPEPVAYSASAARWVETSLLPAVRNSNSGPAAGHSSSVEALLLWGLAGAEPLAGAALVEWEGHRYRVDLAAAERLRLETIRRRQGGPTLDDCLSVAKSVAVITDRASTASDIHAASARLLEIAPRLHPRGGRLFGFAAGQRLDRLVSAATSASGRTAKDPDPKLQLQARARTDLSRGLDVVLADVLASLAYALATGDPDSALMLGGNPAPSHDFGIGATADQTGPWDPPVTVRAGSSSALRGSILGLEGGLGFSWLRPTTAAIPAHLPTFDAQNLRGLGESVAALVSSRPGQPGADWIVSALARGRSTVAALVAEPARLDRKLAGAGIEQWRRRIIRRLSAVGSTAVSAYLSLGELVAIGAGGSVPPAADEWGLSQRPIDGSMWLKVPPRLGWHEMSGRGAGFLPARVPDATIRVLEHLANAGLPASLAPGVLSQAAWDVARNARVADTDDWLPVVRTAQAITPDLTADYVAALTHEGPMLPVKPRAMAPR